jgi:hypothetical protein
MFSAIIEQAHFLPAAVAELVHLSGDALQSGLDGDSGYAFVLSGSKLLIWSYAQGKAAPVKTIACPSSAGQRCFIRVLSQQSAVSVVLCTADGRLSVWLDTHYLSQPYTQQIFSSSSQEGAVVAALAAISAEQPTGPGFLTVVSTVDGGIYLFQVNQSGLFPKQFLARAAPSKGGLGLVGKVGSFIGSIYAEAFNPLHKVQRQEASDRPAVALSLQRVDAARYRLLVLTDEALDCWLVRAPHAPALVPACQATLRHRPLPPPAPRRPPRPPSPGPHTPHQPARRPRLAPRPPQLSLGVRSSEELLWSYALQQVLAAELHAPCASPLALAASPSGDACYVWSACQEQVGPGPGPCSGRPPGPAAPAARPHLPSLLMGSTPPAAGRCTALADQRRLPPEGAACARDTLGAPPPVAQRAIGGPHPAPLLLHCTAGGPPAAAPRAHAAARRRSHPQVPGACCAGGLRLHLPRHLARGAPAGVQQRRVRAGAGRTECAQRLGAPRARSAPGRAAPGLQKPGSLRRSMVQCRGLRARL